MFHSTKADVGKLIVLYTVDVAIFAGGRFRKKVDQTVHVRLIFKISLIVIGVLFCVRKVFANNNQWPKCNIYIHTKIPRLEYKCTLKQHASLY